MKPVLKNMILWFLFGLSFSVGAIFVVVIYDKFEVEVYEWRNMPFDTKIVDYPKNVEILSAKRVESEKYRITGEVANTGADRWVVLKIRAIIFAGDAVVNECKSSVMDIPPGVNATYVVVCNHTHGVNLPENISHKLVIYEGVSTKLESKHNKSPNQDAQ